MVPGVVMVAGVMVVVKGVVVTEVDFETIPLDLGLSATVAANVK